MKFGIEIIHDRRKIRLTVEKLALNGLLEQFEVTARNRSFRVQTNRLLLRNKGLKFKRADWKIVAGVVSNRTIRENIFAAIDAKMNEIESL